MSLDLPRETVLIRNEFIESGKFHVFRTFDTFTPCMDGKQYGIENLRRKKKLLVVTREKIPFLTLFLDDCRANLTRH